MKEGQSLACDRGFTLMLFVAIIVAKLSQLNHHGNLLCFPNKGYARETMDQ